MLAKQRDRRSKSNKPSLYRIAQALRLGGWIGFWSQLALGLVAVLSLLFVIAGLDFEKGSAQGASVSIFWAICGVLSLAFGTYLSLRYTLVARGLTRKSDPQPRKSDTLQLLRAGVYTGVIGTALALIGSGISVSLLVAKTISQPPGMAITDPSKIVRALDVFIVLANNVGVAANFFGAVLALWMLDRIRNPQS